MPADAVTFDPSRPYAQPYRRVSTVTQIEGTGLDRQERSRSDADIAQQVGLPLHPHPLVDHGLSGYSGENVFRGEMGKLLRRIALDQVPRGVVIILDEWTRLTRMKNSRAERLFSDLIHAGIGFFIKKSNQLINAAVIDGPGGSIILAFALIQLGIGHEESATKSRNVRFAKREKQKLAIETGRPATANTPGWLVTVGDKRDPKRTYDFLPGPLYVIERVFREIHRQGVWSIVNGLNRDWLTGDERCAPWGLRTERGSSGWSVATVASLLHDRRLLGELTWTEVDGETGALVERQGETHVVYPVVPGMTEKRFQAAQQAIATRRGQFGGGRRAGHGGRRGDGFPNMLSSLVHCAACGGPMVFRRYRPTGRETVYQWLRCRSAHNGTGCVQKAAIRYLEIERQVLDACTGVLFEPGSLAPKSSQPTIADEIERITARLKFISKRSSALMDRDDVTEEDIAFKLAEWRTEKATLNRDLLAAQERQRAEANVTGAGEHILAVRRLCTMATSLGEGQERAEARADINGALRAIIDSIALAPGETMIWIGGGTKVTVISAEDGTFSGYADLCGKWLWQHADGRLTQHSADPLLERYSLALGRRFPDRRATFTRRYT
ncbi:recombinase zinc beta ribbon domain-containing protein [Belnapia sp. T6]|uniref:Recombinase zinc beta ribbon domain-containing protein n=1 Tax=Belnapia mucosa TaxID=2804532 RepID=A0ABS1V2L3_9PROT|nr:recombinase zinc beta ribbon domain-containing protein [Belnapia mucosa]MBL6454523.1 recombinase zinc beta ribbon domain-containing protein [Belnapia mucosa]